MLTITTRALSVHYPVTHVAGTEWISALCQ